MMKSTPVPSNAAGLAADRFSSPARLSRNASQNGRSQHAKPLMRRYEIAHLTETNDIQDTTRLAPALPVFEDCFAAIGRGAILQTTLGPRAVEDLLPGDEVVTASAGPQTLLWRGMMTLVPGAQTGRPEMNTLTRVTADAFGPARPSPDLVLGPSARMRYSAAGMRTLTGSDAAFVPVRDFIDQSQIIELTPATPVQVFQLGFARQERLRVNGIEIESLHPGAPHMMGLSLEMQNLLVSLFPHVQRLTDFGDMLHPRIRLRDLDIFAVA